MRTNEEIKSYRNYLREQIDRMTDKEYGNCNKSLLDTYRAKLEALNYLTRECSDREDRLSLCKWLVGG